MPKLWDISVRLSRPSHNRADPAVGDVTKTPEGDLGCRVNLHKSR